MKKTGYWKNDYIWDYNMYTIFAPCGLYYCAFHQVWVGTYFPKSNHIVHDAPEVQLYYDEFGTMLKTLVNGTSKMDYVSFIIAKVCILIGIFTTETIPCDSYNITSETMDNYDKEVA